jgi:hypothetical protein
MNRKYTNCRYLGALEKKVLVFDGRSGTRRDKIPRLAHESPAGWRNESA